MKRRVIITLIVIVLALVVPLTVCWCLQPRPSEAFLRYRDNAHLDVAYFPGYPLDDTLRIDVTTITATDSAGWNTLVEDFGFEKVIKESNSYSPRRAFGMCIIPKTHVDKSLAPSVIDKDMVIMQYDEKAIYIFHIKTIKQMRAIIHKYTTEISCLDTD